MNAESQDSTGQQPAMLAALEAVTSWQREVEDDAARRQREIDSQEERIQADIAELERELKNISSLRAEANKQLDKLPGQVEQRTHEAILGALQADGALLAERAALYTAAGKARDEKVSTLASEPGMAQKLEAFEQLELNRESTLGAVPAFYRNLLLQ
jgi:chromosome segregation ATPase